MRAECWYGSCTAQLVPNRSQKQTPFWLYLILLPFIRNVQLCLSLTIGVRSVWNSSHTTNSRTPYAALWLSIFRNAESDNGIPALPLANTCSYGWIKYIFLHAVVRPRSGKHMDFTKFASDDLERLTGSKYVKFQFKAKNNRHLVLWKRKVVNRRNVAVLGCLDQLRGTLSQTYWHVVIIYFFVESVWRRHVIYCY